MRRTLTLISAVVLLAVVFSQGTRNRDLWWKHKETAAIWKVKRAFDAGDAAALEQLAHPEAVHHMLALRPADLTEPTDVRWRPPDRRFAHLMGLIYWGETGSRKGFIVHFDETGKVVTVEPSTSQAWFKAQRYGEEPWRKIRTFPWQPSEQADLGNHHDR